MEVILLEDVPGTGKAGDKKVVADGFGRNFLVPKGMAIVATPTAVKSSEIQRKIAANRKQRTAGEKTALAGNIEALEVKFTAKVGGKEKLYGSITSADIAERLSALLGQTIDKKDIKLDYPIRQLGPVEVPIKLAQDISARIKVVVEEEQPEEVKP